MLRDQHPADSLPSAWLLPLRLVALCSRPVALALHLFVPLVLRLVDHGWRLLVALLADYQGVNDLVLLLDL